LALGATAGTATAEETKPEYSVEFVSEFEQFLKKKNVDLYEQFQEFKKQYRSQETARAQEAPAPAASTVPAQARQEAPRLPPRPLPTLNLTGEFTYTHKAQTDSYSTRAEMSRSDTKDTIVGEFTYVPSTEQRRFNIGASTNFATDDLKGNASVFVAGDGNLSTSSYGINVAGKTKRDVHFGGALERSVSPEGESDQLVYGHVGKTFTSRTGSQTTLKVGAGRRTDSDLLTGCFSHTRDLNRRNLGAAVSAGFVAESNGDQRINGAVGIYNTEKPSSFGFRAFAQFSKTKDTRYGDDIFASATLAVGDAKLGAFSTAAVPELTRSPGLNYPGIAYPDGYPTDYRLPPKSFYGRDTFTYTFVKKPINLEMHNLQASHRFDDFGDIRQPTVGAGYTFTSTGNGDRHEIGLLSHFKYKDRFFLYGDVNLPTTNTARDATATLWASAHHKELLE
ncbi:hypothetical protein KY336_04075, partial [Candidatus Woesearchaeota archaeon]|nr:hypothetical protein [Candidatus Woesearchaeota archaeon]